MKTPVLVADEGEYSSNCTGFWTGVGHRREGQRTDIDFFLPESQLGQGISTDS